MQGGGFKSLLSRHSASPPFKLLIMCVLKRRYTPRISSYIQCLITPQELLLGGGILDGASPASFILGAAVGKAQSPQDSGV